MRQSLNSNNPLHKIQRMQIIDAMRRAGCNAQDSDCCDFKGQYPCPYFKQQTFG
jgi:hypothetical protein